MISKLKKPVSILLSLIMVFSVFAIVPLSASAAVGDVLPESEYLTFTAEEAGSTVTLDIAAGDKIQYDLNGAGLTGYPLGMPITLQNVGDYVRFCGKDAVFNSFNHVAITGKVAASGNIMSLRLDDDGKVQGLDDYCFQNMFFDCTGLTSAPELPETELTDSCYYRMFYGCENLTKAPALPATTLANYCYYRMFYGCKSLTKAPELPATNLAERCYNNMFNGCTSLTELPALPATTLANRCYYYMFYGCSKICISDEAGTFDDITYSAEYRIPTTGEGTSADDALYGMFNGTGGKFTGTPDINTIYYVPAPAPTTYTITDASVNGTVTASVNGTNVTEAAENADVTLTVAPAEGYQFVSISAGDVSLTTVTEGSQYSFTMPKKPVTVTAVFEEIPAPELPDVIKDCTYYDSYHGVYANVPFAGLFSDIQNGAIIFDSHSNIEKSIMDTKDYSYKFYDQTGTELQTGIIYSDDSADGYGYRVIFNVFELSNPISGPLYIVATAPAPETFKVYVKKLTGETYTIENLTGDTTVAQLKEIIANQIDIPATAQRLIFAGKQIEDAKTLAEYNIVEESTIHLVIRYTVTWKNWNGDVLETDENVAAGSTPTYDGATPVRPEDMNATYTFSAWDGNGVTYLIGVNDLPPVTGDVTYTAVYTADIKKLFVAHSVTLGGDIGVNFYIDSNVAGVKDADTAVVKFAWDGGKYKKEVNLKELTPNDKGWLKATVNVVAAQMAHKIEAVAYINGNMFYTADMFSVQDYAEQVIADPSAVDSEKPEQIKALAEALLHYGATAQIVFADSHTEAPAPADANIDAADFSGVTAEAVQAAIAAANGDKTADDIMALGADFGGKYFTHSLIFLSNNTLRIYFTKDNDSFDPGAFDGNQSNYYFYVEKTGISAAELDVMQDFTVGENHVQLLSSRLRRCSHRQQHDRTAKEPRQGALPLQSGG